VINTLIIKISALIDVVVKKCSKMRMLLVGASKPWYVIKFKGKPNLNT